MAIPIQQPVPAEQEETVTVSMPRSTFDMAREFVASLGAVMDAAEAKLRSDQKGEKAASRLGAILPELGALGGAPTGLEGFQDELTAASAQQSGLMDSRF